MLDTGLITLIQKNKKYSIFIFLTILTLIISLIQISKPVYFGAEIGQNYFKIIQLNEGKLLLEGQQTSHTWLKLSAFPYYVFYPIFMLTGFHPLTMHWLVVAVSILLVPFSYWITKKMFGEITAIIVVFFNLSTNMMIFRDNFGFLNLTIPLSLILIYQVIKTIKHEKSSPAVTFLLVSIMFTLHASAIIWIPFLIIFFWIYKQFSGKEIIKSIIIFAIPQIPLLINEATRRFSGLIYFVAWIPYRISNFFMGKTMGLSKVSVKDESINIISNFTKNGIFPDNYPWLLGLLYLFILAGLVVVWLKKKDRKVETWLIIMFLYGLLALLLHKNPPIHYFVTLAPIQAVLTARLLSIRWETKRFRLGFVTAICILLILNLYSICTLKLQKNETNTIYEYQLQISKIIIEDANGKSFSLRRIGLLDYYEGGFKENYEYLLWWLGNRPVEDSNLRYVVVEDTSIKFVKDMSLLTDIYGLRLFKNIEK